MNSKYLTNVILISKEYIVLFYVALVKYAYSDDSNNLLVKFTKKQKKTNNLIRAILKAE